MGSCMSTSTTVSAGVIAQRRQIEREQHQQKQEERLCGSGSSRKTTVSPTTEPSNVSIGVPVVDTSTVLPTVTGVRSENIIDLNPMCVRVHPPNNHRIQSTRPSSTDPPRPSQRKQDDGPDFYLMYYSSPISSLHSSHHHHDGGGFDGGDCSSGGGFDGGDCGGGGFD